MDLKFKTATARRLSRILATAAIAMLTTIAWAPVATAADCSTGDAHCRALTGETADSLFEPTADSLSESPAAPPEESPGLARITDLGEMRFNPVTGRFTVAVSGARMTSDPEQVSVFVNNRLLPVTAVALSRSAIEVDYRFDSGLNELLVIAPDSDGRQLRADGLFWAGDNTLVVDVTDDEMNPLDGVRVTVRLGQAGTIKATAVTEAGTARFDNLPEATLLVEAEPRGYTRMRIATASNAGPVLLILKPNAAVATSRQ